MPALEWFEWLETSEAAEWVRAEVWRWPLVLTLHTLGTALTVGFVFLIGLRMFGKFRTLPFEALRRFMPVLWFAVLWQIATGFLMWVTRPLEYSSDGAFELKMVFMVAGAILLVPLHVTIRRMALAREGARKVSAGAVKLAAAIIAMWAGVLIASRLTAQLGSFIAG